MRKSNPKKLLALLLAVIMCFSLFTPMAPSAEAARIKEAEAATTDSGPDLRAEAVGAEEEADALDPEEWITVIVELKGDTTLDVDEFVSEFSQSSLNYSTSTTVANYREELVEAQTDVQAQIMEINSEAEFRYHYTNLLNGFAARVQYKDIAAIEDLGGVLNVYRTLTYDYDDGWEEEEDIEYVSLGEYYATYGETGVDLLDEDAYDGSITQMSVQAAWDAGYTGAGKVVGVFDSSLRYTHEMFQYMDPAITAEKPDNYKTKDNLLQSITNNSDTINLFDSGWGSWFHGREETGFSEAEQEAIRNGEFFINEKVPFGVDYMDGDLEVWDDDSGSHGTHVSGITAGNAENINGARGVAYDAQIMFFKVFSEHDNFGQESDEAVFAALDDAVTLGVNAFNLSLGIGNGFTTMNTYAQAGYQKAYNRAAAAGISIAVSAGNDGRGVSASDANRLVKENTTILPNSSTVGFSGSLFAPMTVAAADGTGYTYVSYSHLTAATFTDGDGSEISTISLTDNNTTNIYEALTGEYELVDCGLGSEEEILAATGATSLEGALAGKVALVQRGDLTFILKGENAFNAGAVGVVMANNTGEGAQALQGTQIYASIPTFGMIAGSAYTNLKSELADGTVKVSFEGSFVGSAPISRSYADAGPSSFSSWGVTEALRMKPDIMAPGRNILSAGAGNDKSMSVKSGTSMASPNMQGAFALIQQYVDENLTVFDLQRGTQEYTDFVNQLAASTAEVYSPLVAGSSDRQDLYFSPRRQGAGMVNLERVINSKVVLHNDTPVNNETGEAPRTKVELFDKLGDEFTFNFTMDNYNNESRTFDVLSVLQTDNTTSVSGREGLIAPGATGSGIDAIEDAIMTVQSVSGDAVINTASLNINKYSADVSAASITVPANSSTVITIKVALPSTMDDEYSDKFPNGMFIEGYVFFDSDHEDVNIPFMGFRGDWSKAPIFDLKTVYDDISKMEVTDLEYPIFHITALGTMIDQKSGGSEAILGANQFIGEAFPGYSEDYATNMRSYYSNLRNEGSLSSSFSAISPDDDGNYDIVFADLALLRNAKALCVVITDENNSVVKVLGPEYEFFECKPADGNRTQQVASTFGTKYQRNLEWDGTDEAGKVVADGQYNYTVYAMNEYDYLNMTDNSSEAVLDELRTSENSATVTMPVKVDTEAPSVTSVIEGDKWTATISDDGSGIQAYALYYGLSISDSPIIVNGNETKLTVDLAELAEKYGEGLFGGVAGSFDPTKLSVQVVDYAYNITVHGAMDDVAGETYTVNYDANNGQGEVTDTYSPYSTGATVHVLSGRSLSRDGYEFVGWNTAASGSGTAYAPGDTFTISANVVLYAQWQKDSTPGEEYTVTYYANGGTGTVTDTKSPYEAGFNVTVLNGSSLSRDGYEFVGWNTAASGSGTAYAPGDTFTISANVVLYAQWQKDSTPGEEYTVTYYANGGTGTVTDTKSPYEAGFNVTVLSGSSLSRDGYEFVGWNTAASGSGTAYAPDDTFTISANVVLYAQWKSTGPVKTPTVTYYANGGEGEVADGNSPYAENAEVIVLSGEDLTREGYRFIGWNTEEDGSGTAYSAGDKFTIKDDVSLYAQWIIVAFTADHVAYINGYEEDGVYTVRPEKNVSRAEIATMLYRLMTEESRAAFWSNTNDFSDVKSTDWYNNAVSTMANMGVLAGYEDGTFAGNANLRRGELAKILANFTKGTYEGADKFSDIRNHWAKDYINSVADEGWIEGFSDGTFKPDDYVTRAQAVTMINRMLGRDKVEELHEDMVTWTDNSDTKQWYYKAIQEASNSHEYTLNDDGNELWTKVVEAPDWASMEKEWEEEYKQK